MKRVYFLLLIVAYSLVLVGVTSWFWLERDRKAQTGSSCFDSWSCLSPDYMARNGVMSARLSKADKEAMREYIREYYAASYRETLPKEYEAKLSAASTPEQKKKYTAILESLKKGIDVDPLISEPRAYEGLDRIVAMVASISAYIPGEGNVGWTGGVSFFRLEGDSYKFVRTEPVGEDVNTLESMPVERFKRDEGIAR